MTQFRKKPVVIEAKQASGTPESNREIIDWTRGSATPAFMDTEVRNCSADHPDGFDYPVLKINTLEGTMTVAHGDWVIKGVKGEFYPCKRDIFEATYDEVPDAVSNESSHDWRHSSSYGGQLCADCGAVKGSRRGGLECRDPNAGVATAALPVVDHGPDSLERSRADTHASAVLYPAIKLAMDEMDLDPLLSPSVNARRAYNALFDAFWSEAPAPTSEMAKRRPDNPTAEAADFLANVKACDLSGDAPCEACQ